MKRIFVNTSIYTMSTILPKAVGFVLLPIYTRFLSPEEYGIIGAMVVFQTILGVLFSLCLERSIPRLYWDYKTEEERKIFLGTITISIFLISVVLLAFLFIFQSYVGRLYKSIEFHPFYIYAIGISFVSIFSLVPEAYLLIKEKAGALAVLSLSNFVVNAGLILWFIIVEGEGAVGYLKALMLGAVVFLPLYIYLTLKTVIFRFKPAIFRDCLEFSLPIIPTIITSWVLTYSDRIFIERYLRLEDVGIYALGYKLASIIGIFCGAFSRAFTPTFFNFATRNDARAREVIGQSNNFYMIVLMMMCFAMALFSKEIIILFDERYAETYRYLPLISFSFLFSQGTGITSKFFQQSKKMLPNMSISIFSAVLNGFLNFILIPPYGIYGAVYATILSYAFCFLGGYAYTKRNCFFIPLDLKTGSLFIVYATAICVIFEYGRQANFFLLFALKSAVFIVMAVLFIKKYFYPLKKLVSGKDLAESEIDMEHSVGI